MNILNDLCRLCARKLDQSSTNIFAPENSHVLLAIVQCFPITISKEDSYPKNVCIQCISTLNGLITLRDRSLVAVEIFKDVLSTAVKNENSENLAEQVKQEVLTDEFYENAELKFRTGGTTVPGNRPFHSNTQTSPTYEDQIGSSTHMEHARPLPEPSQFFFQDFGNMFATKHHSRVHAGVKPYQCQTCGTRFGVKSDLMRHEMIHTGERPFSCQECGKSFCLKGNLAQHQRIHSDERPFRCEICGNSFSQKPYLVQHLRRHNVHKLFHCPDCGKSFSMKDNLTKHQRIHSGERPFHCQECATSFTLKSDLLRHERIHSGEKPFSCHECGKCFSLKGNLTQHQRVHSYERLFPFQVCHKSFDGFTQV